jgi:DNA invertase Pin-like site-specific DNA recombinase
MSKKIGYARTSTASQEAGLQAQIEALTAFGCDRVYKEQVSSIATRDQFDAALDYVRDGDTLVVTKLDRAFRSVEHAVSVVRDLEKKDVGLIVLDMGGQPVDLRTPSGKLIFNVMVSVAQFEREIMLERQREGIKKAQEAKLYKGRKPTARMQSDAVIGLKAEGFTPTEIVKRTGLSRASVYRILRTL